MPSAFSVSRHRESGFATGLPSAPLTMWVLCLRIQAQETDLHLARRLGNAECLFGFAPSRERLRNGLAVGAVDDVGLVLDQHLAQAVEVLHKLLSMDNPFLIERLEGHQ